MYYISEGFTHYILANGDSEAGKAINENTIKKLQEQISGLGFKKKERGKPFFDRLLRAMEDNLNTFLDDKTKDVVVKRSKEESSFYQSFKNSIYGVTQ